MRQAAGFTPHTLPDWVRVGLLREKGMICLRKVPSRRLQRGARGRKEGDGKGGHRPSEKRKRREKRLAQN